MSRVLLSATLAILAAASPAAAESSSNFDHDRAGLVPPGFYTAAGQWKVKGEDTAPSPPNVLAQVARNSAETSNLTLIAGSRYGNLKLSVKMRAIDGSSAQGGGLAFRARDGRNYYLVSYNPLANEFVLYRVQNFGKVELRRARTESFPGWHTLRVIMEGERIQCYLDGTKYLEVRDATFREAGQVGLWTGGDAVTYFDDLSVTGR